MTERDPKSGDEESRERLARSADRFRVLAETSKQFASIVGVDALLDAAVHRLSDIVGTGAAIWLLGKDGKDVDLSLVATYHPDPELDIVFRGIADNTPMRVGVGVAGNVVLSGQAALLANVDTAALAASAPAPFAEAVIRLGVRSLLAVPLRARERVLGAVVLSRSDSRFPYAVADQDLAQDIADRAGLAVENALLVKELEARTAELERANAALRKSENRHRRLAESGVIGIVVSDMMGRTLEANDAFLAMTGYSHDDVDSGKLSNLMFIPPEEHANVTVMRDRLTASGVASPGERMLVRKDGSRFPALLGGARLDEGSEIIAFVLDLSEKKHAEAEARLLSAQKTAVMDAALDAIILMNHEGRIIDFNAAAERTFGYARDEAVGRQLGDLLIPETHRDAHTAGLARYLQSGETRVLGRRLELAARRRDGSLFDAEVAIVRIEGEGPPVFTGYIRDITERRRAAEAEILRHEKDAAEDANRELEAFSYSVAHDLRTPLRGINGFSTALLEDHGHVLDENGKALLRHVTQSTRQMSELIDALLALASLSRIELEWQKVDLAEIARSVVEQLHAVEPMRQVILVAPAEILVMGDPRLLRALLENVIGNAWKFTREREDARIELSVEKDAGGSRRVVVTDNGVGFDMAYSAKLFAPFQRLHTRTQFEGSGVGLATVQRIVQRHGGEVTAEGRVDDGATIAFTLPTDPPRSR